jgi:hypothetical protein
MVFSNAFQRACRKSLLGQTVVLWVLGMEALNMNMKCEKEGCAMQTSAGS